MNMKPEQTKMKASKRALVKMMSLMTLGKKSRDNNVVSELIPHGVKANVANRAIDIAKRYQFSVMKNNKSRSCRVIFLHILMFLGLIGSSFVVQSQEYVITAGNAGKITLPVNSTISFTPLEDKVAYTNWGYALFYGLRIDSQSTGVGGFDCIDYTSRFVTTSDGVWGYKLANDVVLTFDGTMTGNIWYHNNGSLRTVSSSFSSSSGYVGWNGSKTPVTFCAGYPALQLNTSATVQINRSVVTASYQGSIGLYAGPQAAVGTYSIPSVELIKAIDSSSGYNAVNLLSTQAVVRVVPKLSCVISAPPAINFGVIHGLGINENAFIAQQTGNLTINCDGGYQDLATSVKVQVLGERAPCCNYILRLKNNSGANSPGEIRGWINQTPTNSCSGSSNNLLRFGDSSKWFDGGTLKPGTNLIPYVFNLCGSGDNKAANLGETSATATVNISWD